MQLEADKEHEAHALYNLGGIYTSQNRIADAILVSYKSLAHFVEKGTYTDV